MEDNMQLIHSIAIANGPFRTTAEEINDSGKIRDAAAVLLRGERRAGHQIVTDMPGEQWSVYDDAYRATIAIDAPSGPDEGRERWSYA
jgi:hypothetical protein